MVDYDNLIKSNVINTSSRFTSSSNQGFGTKKSYYNRYSRQFNNKAFNYCYSLVSRRSYFNRHRQNRYHARKLLVSSAVYQLRNLKAKDKYQTKYNTAFRNIRRSSQNCDCEPIHKRILRHQFCFNSKGTKIRNENIANDNTRNKYKRLFVDKDIEILETDSEDDEEITKIFESKFQKIGEEFESFEKSDNHEKTEIEAKRIDELDAVKNSSGINKEIVDDDNNIKAVVNSELQVIKDFTDLEQISIENQGHLEEYTENGRELNNNSKHNVTQNIATENDKISAEVDASTNANENKLEDSKNNEDKPFDDFKIPKEIPRRNKTNKKVSLKPEPRFILTHVLEGHIIQESNYPFPITQIKKENPPESSQEGGTTSAVGIKKEKLIEESENSNPFARLQKSTVKSWTAEDLSSHLIQFNWCNTAAILKHNEIDGQTLLLVSKTQLVIIGVDEEEAEVICEFVQRS